MFKHPEAVYRDAENVPHTIKACNLIHKTTIEEARANRLFDVGEEFRLSVRGGTSPHFFAPAANGRLLADTRAEPDPVHDARIDDLLKRLRLMGQDDALIEIGTNVWNTETTRYEWSPLGEIQRYTWEGEVTRAIGETTKCRHDVFGANVFLKDKPLNLTDRFPWVAIEVIHTHFPTEATFQGFMALSRLLPLIVLFDLVQAPNYFMQLVDKPIDGVNVRRIRAAHYIYKGQFWKNGTTRNITNAKALEASIRTGLDDFKKKTTTKR